VEYEKGCAVISNTESTSASSDLPEGMVPPASAETAPVAVPGAPPPPPHEAAEAGHELAKETRDEETADASGPSDLPDEEEAETDLPFAAPLELIDESVADEDLKFEWYILKVQVNREDSIKDALLRRVKMNGLDRYFKEIVVPTEDVVEFTKTGKRRVVKKKLYPGYILVNLAVTDESWFVVRETPGIGDFTGSAGKPTPMDPKDVERILRSSKVLPEEEGAAAKTAIPFKTGDRVRVKEGYFQNFEGDVHAIDQAHGRVTVMINIFGRATPVEIEHWQIEAV
jgi:transcriptional antiterminator NusG